MNDQDRIADAWKQVDVVGGNLRQNRLELGQLFLRLRGLYSERSADIRRSSGHGVFEVECRLRGFAPRTVRDLINDFEIEWSVCTGHAKPGVKTSAQKRREARQRAQTQRPRRNRRSTDNNIDLSDDFARFARLLPYVAAKRAFREAAKHLHPDHGGDAAAMTELNLLWQKLEPLYRASDGVWPIDVHNIKEEHVH
jgi:hypothetical protein